MILARGLARQRAGELVQQHSRRMQPSRPWLLVTCVTNYESGPLLFSIPRQDTLAVPLVQATFRLQLPSSPPL